MYHSFWVLNLWLLIAVSFLGKLYYTAQFFSSWVHAIPKGDHSILSFVIEQKIRLSYGADCSAVQCCPYILYTADEVLVCAHWEKTY